MNWQYAPKIQWLPWYSRITSWYYGNGQPGDFQYTDYYAGWLFWQFRWRRLS